MPSALVVDDDPTVGEVVGAYLARAGFEVHRAADGATALDLAARTSPDVVVLDLMLPGVDGLEVCRRLRRDQPAVPVLMLTALGEETDRIHGLEVGADDYVTKPFSPRELVLRVQAILRRARETNPPAGGRVLWAGPVRLDLAAHQATMDGVELALTPTEFRLLQALLERKGRTMSRRQLLEKAWDVRTEIADRLQTRTVDMHVRRLRSKLGAVGPWVETVRGFGYRFRIPEEHA